MNNEQKVTNNEQTLLIMEIIWDKDLELTFQKFKEKERCINKTKLLPMKY